jgi:hypothetical protein
MVGVVMIGRVDVCFSDIELIMRMTAVIMAVAMGGRFDDAHMKRRGMRSGRRKRKQEHANDGRKSSRCIEISVFRSTHHSAHIDAFGDSNKIPD